MSALTLCPVDVPTVVSRSHESGFSKVTNEHTQVSDRTHAICAPVLSLIVRICERICKHINERNGIHVPTVLGRFPEWVCWTNTWFNVVHWTTRMTRFPRFEFLNWNPRIAQNSCYSRERERERQDTILNSQPSISCSMQSILTVGKLTDFFWNSPMCTVVWYQTAPLVPLWFQFLLICTFVCTHSRDHDQHYQFTVNICIIELTI